MNDNYYVYFYRCPETGEIMYVGKGTGSRAWNTSRMKGDTQERHEWKQGLMEAGYLPDDWVMVSQIHRNITEEEALKEEKEYITHLQPLLNRQSNPKHKYSKINEEGLETMKALRAMGYSYSQTAELTGGSTMSCHRAINGGYKNVH